MRPAARRARRQTFIFLQAEKYCLDQRIKRPVSADLKVAELGLYLGIKKYNICIENINKKVEIVEKHL